MVEEDGTFSFLINHVGRERIPKSNKVAAHLPKIPANFNELRKWKIEQARPWLEAMCKEFNKLVNEKKIKIENIATIKKRIEAKSPEGKIWNNLWQFDLKLDRDGNMTDYKARFCFQGNHRRLGIDHSHAEI